MVLDFECLLLVFWVFMMLVFVEIGMVMFDVGVVVFGYDFVFVFSVDEFVDLMIGEVCFCGFDWLFLVFFYKNWGCVFVIWILIGVLY